MTGSEHPAIGLLNRPLKPSGVIEPYAKMPNSEVIDLALGCTEAQQTVGVFLELLRRLTSKELQDFSANLQIDAFGLKPLHGRVTPLFTIEGAEPPA